MAQIVSPIKSTSLAYAERSRNTATSIADGYPSELV